MSNETNLICCLRRFMIHHDALMNEPELVARFGIRQCCCINCAESREAIKRAEANRADHPPGPPNPHKPPYPRDVA